MAAQYAGLEIVERHPHYAVLPYIKPGFDATVWFGDEYGYGAHGHEVQEHHRRLRR